VRSSTGSRYSRILFRAALGLCAAALACGAFAGSALAQAAPAEKTETAKKAPPQFSASAILIERTNTPENLAIPDDFRVATFEYVVQQVSRTHCFKTIYRSGDSRAKAVPDLVTLRMEAQGYQKGSEAVRGATTVKGWTSLKVNVVITDASGKTLVEKEVQGRVRFMGENLNATYDLGKKVAGVVRDNFKATTP
jgi:hypothetical protein